MGGLIGHTRDEARVQPDNALWQCRAAEDEERCEACAEELARRFGERLPDAPPICPICGRCADHVVGCPIQLGP